MNVKVKGKTHFYHGNVEVKQGAEVEFTKTVAQDLEKNGLVEIIGESEPQAETKMAEPVENKMAEAPANKRKPKE